MDLYQQRRAIALFHKVGFDLPPIVLQKIDRHYADANGRLVMVISHTCTNDFLLGLLLFGCSSIPITMYTRFRSPILKELSKRLGMIAHKEGVSNTQNIIETLRPKQTFGLLIALARTEPNARVHAGYFHIAQALQAPIIVLGFDYMRKSGYVSSRSWLPEPQVDYKTFQDDAEKQILAHIAMIYPQKPHLQVGFEDKKYPHLLFGTRGKKIFVPNSAYLYYLVTNERIPHNAKLLVFICFGFLALFFVVWLLTIIFC